MANENQSQVLQKLATVSEQFRSGVNAELFDDCSVLSPVRLSGWCRVLSSIATSEGYEAVVLKPIGDGLAYDRITSTYLQSHALDEDQHALWLTTYLKKSLGYVKAKATLSDALVYKNLLPLCSAFIRRVPLLGVMVLEVYERFSMDLYAQLAVRAEHDNLPQLQRLLLRIRADEQRHLAGLSAIQSLYSQRRSYPLVARLAAKLILKLVRFDLQFTARGLNNRDLLAHFRILGIDSLQLEGSVSNACRLAERNFLTH